jgi:hypothetical protein
MRNVKHVVFYGPPASAHFYAEILNVLPTVGSTSALLYTRFDSLAMHRLLGSHRGQRMLKAEKTTHLLC